MEMMLHNKTFVMFLIVSGLLIGFSVDQSFAGQVNHKYWPTKEWRTSTPEAQDMDSTQLGKMNNFLENKCPAVRSVLVIRNGYIAFEKYYIGDANTTHTIYSVTKSITSALIGIALGKGYIKSIDQKMVTFFPEYASEITDSRLNKITIRHLLTMSAGFETDPGQGPPGMRTSFAQPIITEPGSHAAYNSGSSHLLSGIISKSTKMSTLEFGDKHLFKPLGIQKPVWRKGVDGYTRGGYGLWMRPRDMAKIGYLYVQNGVWDNNQIIPAKWIKESTQKHSTISWFQKEVPYGYQWWIGSTNSSYFKGHSGFSAVGYGGQYIDVIPDLDIVIVATSNTSGSGYKEPKHNKIAASFIVPSVLK
jgi:CubicO group peptidase (beta-lactamase class C family)